MHHHHNHHHRYHFHDWIWSYGAAQLTSSLHYIWVESRRGIHACVAYLEQVDLANHISLQVKR